MNPQFGTNANAVRKKRVYYTETSTIYEGMPVCYEYDATANVLGWDKAAGGDAACQSSPNTTAEGNQNEGKFLRVENPNLVLTIVGTITGTFTVGETVTQAVTLATGIVDVANTGATTVYIRPLTGTFTVSANTITGGSSGATVANPSAISVTTDNLQWFAGVVAGTSEAGKTGPRWLDIYLPNGAIVPVRKAAIATATGRTILAINTSTQTFGNPTTDIPNFETDSDTPTPGNIDARSVAVAEETTSAAVGLCLARLDPTMFVYQGGQTDREMQVAAGTTNCSVNRMMVEFLNTGGNCQALHYRAELSAGGNAGKGVFRFETILTGAVDNAHVFGMESHLEIGAAMTGGVQLSPLRLTVRSKNSNPDLSGCGKLSALQIEWHMRKTTTGELDSFVPTNMSSIFYINADAAGSEPGQFMIVERYSNINAHKATGTFAAGATDYAIPIRLEGAQYYLCAFAETGL